jgi:hypothetical protein
MNALLASQYQIAKAQIDQMETPQVAENDINRFMLKLIGLGVKKNAIPKKTAFEQALKLVKTIVQTQIVTI